MTPFRALLLALPVLALSACGSGGGGSGQGALSPKARAALAALPAPFSGADLKNGEAQFSLCRSCHTIIQGGANMTGPNLYGVFGRKAASKADYNYSAALKAKAAAKGLVWDADTLNQWLAGPQAFAPGTKMSFVGIKDATDRRDLIGYLKVASSGG